ncbi:MAG: exopolysaccharide biosynthesis protein, partial [Oxalobacteraceae bacterium]
MANSSHPDDNPRNDPDRGLPYGVLEGAYGGVQIGDLLRQVAIVIRRNIWLILAIIAVGVVAAVAATMLDTPRYTAVTSVQINDQGERVLGEEMDSEADVNPGLDTERFLNTQIDILNSRGLAERVSRRLQLAGNQRFYAAMERSVPGANVSQAAQRDQVIGMLRRNLVVELPRNTRVARISFTSADPALSASIANVFAEEAIQASLQRRFDNSAYARNFISQQLDEARVRLETSERETNTYARTAGLIRTREAGTTNEGGTSSGSVTTSSLMQINQAANEAKAKRIAAEGRWRAEQAAPLLSSQAVLSNPTVQDLMTRRAELDGELKKNRERYLDDHPTVRQATSELNTVNQQLTQVATGVRNSIRAEFVAAQNAEVALLAQVGSLQGDTLAEQDRSVRYNTLAREADTNRSLYDGLLQRYRELNAAAGITSSNLSIIDKADVPLTPSSPNMLLNLMAGLFGGAIMAAFIVFLRDQMDDMIRVPEDVENKVELALLGVIPNSGTESPIEAMANPKSTISEAYGSLRGALLYSTRSGLPRVLAVTSAQPTEGKSTTAFATASGFARMGRSVLLIDADMRRPSVHRNIGHDNRRGLSTLLVSTDPIASAVVPSGVANFD